MFFDKDKIELSLELEKDVYMPGETIRGTFIAKVLKEVKVTALRLHFYAKERGEVSISKGGANKEKGEDEALHFEKLFTFFGYSKESGRKGGATLAATPEGEEGLTYPFEIALPATVAPSFSCRFKKDGEASLTYKLRAMCVIDKGFDGRLDKYIKVLSTTPQQQYDSTRDLMHAMQPQMVQLPPSSSCCCFKKDSNPSLSVEIACPQLVVYDEDGAIAKGAVESNAAMIQGRNSANNNSVPLPDTPAPAAGVRHGRHPCSGEDRRNTLLPVTVKVVNNSSKKTIKTIMLTLNQFVHINCKGVSRAEVRPIATLVHTPPSGGIPPKQAYSATLNLDLGASLSMYGYKNERKSFSTGGIVLPTMATRFVEVSNILEVSFPKLGVTETVSMSDACWFVSAVDQTSKAPPAPVRYNVECILPEEIVGGAME